MALRKKNGWSQEELAEKLNISRQSVSKWESGASIPDIDKIIAMSGIFGVSTDYLLKDELETEQASETGDVYEAAEARSVSLEEANGFLSLVKRQSVWTALASGLFVLSPIPMVVMSGLAEYGAQEGGPGTVRISEDMAGGLGMVILLVMAAIGVAILLLWDMREEKYRYLEKENLALQYGVEGIVRKKKEAFAGRYRFCIVAGVTLCIIGVIPLMTAAAFSAGDFIYIYCTAALLGMVAVAVFLIVWAGCIQGSFDKLLQEGDYTAEEKALQKKTSFFPAVYWCLVTALFLGAGLYSEDWKYTAFIWPVAALVYVAVHYTVKAMAKSRLEKRG
ncbi:MAG: helix-turn-helix transcriptional regulator [Lachnospiraceae bacterium]|nr:helix-turn-helix transcriptional regulator [Lachnospiraceae bacterium]